MLTVKEVLTNKITLDIECIDRVYLNGYVKHLQMPGGLITFIREQMGYPIPSPMLLPPVTQSFRKEVEQYAKEQGLSIVDFAKGEDKDEKARAHLAKFEKKQETSREGPEAQDGLRRHHLIMIAAQEVILILEEGFHFPADSENID